MGITYDDVINCKTASEVIRCAKSLTNGICNPSEINLRSLKKAGMRETQIAYGLSKTLYDYFVKISSTETKEECEKLGINLSRNDDLTIEKWSDIHAKYDHVYKVDEFMHLKWIAEKLMVEEAFSLIEADEKTMLKYTGSRPDYERVKANWQKPTIRQKVIDLAFKLSV